MGNHLYFKGNGILALVATFDRRLRFQYSLSVERSLQLDSPRNQLVLAWYVVMLGKPQNGFLASKPELCTIISKVAMITSLPN